jgi:hypothetical protein
LPSLPATVAPIERSASGLLIGVQIIGPYLEDRTTIAFAALIERESAASFRPPVILAEAKSLLPIALIQIMRVRQERHDRSGQSETSRPNSRRDRFTLNSGLDRSDTVTAATCHDRTYAVQQNL